MHAVLEIRLTARPRLHADSPPTTGNNGVQALKQDDQVAPWLDVEDCFDDMDFLALFLYEHVDLMQMGIWLRVFVSQNLI